MNQFLQTQCNEQCLAYFNFYSMHKIKNLFDFKNQTKHTTKHCETEVLIYTTTT